jgi:type I restriction enzyme S subunit
MNTRTVQLGAVCEFIRGVTFDKADATTRPEVGKTPVLRAGNIGEELDARSDLVWVPDAQVSDEQRLRQNDIAICMSSGSPEVVGKTARVPYNLRASIGSFCGIIRPKSPDEASYLSFFFRSAAFRKHRNAIARGANIQNLRFSQFEEIELEIPSEQRQIAGRLEQADRLRRTRRYALELTDTFLPAAFLELFGDPTTNPLGLPVAELGDFLSFVTSGSRGWADYYAPEGARFIRSLDVRMNSISDEDAVFVKAPNGAEADRTRVTLGDVLLTITGSRIGRVAAVPERLNGAFISQHVAILRLKPGVLPEFLSMFLSLGPGGQRQIARVQYGQTKPGLNLDQIREMRVPVPHVSHQQRFLELAKRVERLHAVQREALRQAEHLFASLLDRAFNG